MINNNMLAIPPRKITYVGYFSQEITQLTKHKAKQEDTNINMEIILAVVGEYLENLEFLLLGGANPLKRADTNVPRFTFWKRSISSIFRSNR